MEDPIVLPVEMGAGRERQVQTLFADSWRRLVLIRLQRQTVLAAHSAITPITIQCVAGSGVLHVEECAYSLTPGVIVPVHVNIQHSVIAEPESRSLGDFFSPTV